MADVLPFPGRGAHFVDARGGHRAMRVTWHHDVGVVVLSLWQGDTCTGTFRLLAEEVPAVLASLSDGLAAGYSADSAPDGPRNGAGRGRSTNPGSIAR